MNEDFKDNLFRVLFWALFIILPSLAVAFIGSWTHPRIVWGIASFFLLVLIGEHVYKKLGDFLERYVQNKKE